MVRVALRRRTVLFGGFAAALGSAGAAYGAVDLGVLPGRARLREALGLTGEDGAVAFLGRSLRAV